MISLAKHRQAPLPVRHVCPCCGYDGRDKLMLTVTDTERLLVTPPVHVDLSSGLLYYRHRSVKLMPLPARLGALLAHRLERVVSHDTIIAELWPGPDGAPMTGAKSVQVHACHLRNRIKPLGLGVEVVIRFGYKMVVL
jgi:DNA-binding response OmpR family regulator